MIRSSFPGSVIGVAVLLLCACSSSTSPSADGDAGAASSSGSSGTPSSSGGVDASMQLAETCPVSPGTGCNMLAFGAIVHPSCSAGTTPTSAGGNITDGNYVLTDYALYGKGADGTCSNSYDRRGAISFHAGQFDIAKDGDPLCHDMVSKDAKQRQTWKVTTTGTTFGGQESCDSANSSLSTGNSWSYTATPTTVVLTDQYSVATYVVVP